MQKGLVVYLNQRIRELRKALGLTLENFGKRIGVTKVAISLIESGKNNITDQMFKSIVREFNVDPHWLETGEGKMFPQLSHQETFMKAATTLFNNKDSSIATAITNFIITYDRLDDTSRRVLDDVFDKYLQTMKESR